MNNAADSEIKYNDENYVKINRSYMMRIKLVITY